MPKAKYLIETSAVPVALNESTPEHCRVFQEATTPGTLHTSVYIRKEFIHRWILYYIRIAFEVGHHDSVASAIYHLTQSYKIREVKTLGHGIAGLLEQLGHISNCRSMAKEFARLAYGKLRKFDRSFRSRSDNHCGCKLGGAELRVDFNNLFDDLRAFVEGQGVVEDCDVNSFLGFKKGNHGRAAKILEDSSCGGTTAGANAQKYISAEKHISCKECARIGDLVIALEQPKYLTLLHIDSAFAVFCSITGRRHKQIASEVAVHNAPK